MSRWLINITYFMERLLFLFLTGIIALMVLVQVLMLRDDFRKIINVVYILEGEPYIND